MENKEFDLRQLTTLTQSEIILIGGGEVTSPVMQWEGSMAQLVYQGTIDFWKGFKAGFLDGANSQS